MSNVLESEGGVVVLGDVVVLVVMLMVVVLMVSVKDPDEQLCCESESKREYSSYATQNIPRNTNVTRA